MQSLKVGLAAICLLTTPALACLSRVGTPPAQEVQGTSISQLEREMLGMVNLERQKRGLGTLEWDERLAVVARAHCRDMLLHNYFAHEDPQGKTLKDRLLVANIPFSLAGENIAFAPNLAGAHQGLMRSPEHRENILRPRFKKIGIGILSIPKGRSYDPLVNGRTLRVPNGELIITQDFVREEF